MTGVQHPPPGPAPMVPPAPPAPAAPTAAPPAPVAPAPRDRLAHFAARLRALFERMSRHTGPGPVAVVLGGLALVAGRPIVAAIAARCGGATQLLARLEVTFDARRFAALLPDLADPVAQRACRDAVLDGFAPIGLDTLFAPLYGLTLVVLYLWTERWRRFALDAQGNDQPAPLADPPLPGERLRDLLVLAPLVAAALDVLVENPTLWMAARSIPDWSIPEPTRSTGVLVLIGSIAGAAKWMLLLAVAWGIVAELLRGPRGHVIRRVRFSVLAVALGAVPLLLVPQGQDILQHLVEDDAPVLRASLAAVVLGLSALTLWYCARRLVQMRFRHDPDDVLASPWYAYFADHVPRMLGIATLSVAGMAFARAAQASTRYLLAAVAGLAIAMLIERFRTSTRRDDHGRIREQAIAAAVAVVVGGVILLAPVSNADRRVEPTLFHLALAAWLCLAEAWALYLFVYYRRAWAYRRAHGVDLTGLSHREMRREAWEPQDSATPDPRLRRLVVAGLVVSAACFVAFVADPIDVGRRLGPLWILAIAATNATFLGSIAVWLHGRTGARVVSIALAMAVLFSLWNENHVVRTIAPAAAGGPARRRLLERHLDEWLQQAPPPGPDGKTPIVLVAAAGGGLRAAWWTAAALAELQDRDSAFARHVFAISGVSGGSLGAAAFTALVRDAAREPAPLTCEAAAPPVPDPGYQSNVHRACVRTFLGDDFLSPVLAKMVAPDLAQRFLPVAIARFDRATAMEQSWEESYRRTTGRPTMAEGVVALTADPALRAWMPVLLLNATHVESGKRYVASPLDARNVLADTRDVVSLLDRDVPLSTAVHNSARFTFVSPAGHLALPNGREYGRLVDGGYFEASGLVTVQEVNALVQRRLDRDTSLRHRFQVVVLYLCNDPLGCRTGAVVWVDSTLADSTPGVPNTSMNELLAPARAVLHTRDARGAMALAQLRGGPDVSFLQLNVCPSLASMRQTRADSAQPTDTAEARLDRQARAKERVVSPPLGWLLSKLARDWMDSSLVAPRPEAASTCRRGNADHVRALTAMLR